MAITNWADVLQTVFDEASGRIRVTNVALVVSDIQIGAVEIKDESTDDRANVVDIGGQNALVVTNLGTSTVSRTPVNEFNTDTITSGSEDTLVSYTVPSGKVFVLQGIEAGGLADGKFTVTDGSTTYAVTRNSGAERTKSVEFPNEPQFAAATVVSIKAKNGYTTIETFEGTIKGFTRAA